MKEKRLDKKIVERLVLIHKEGDCLDSRIYQDTDTGIYYYMSESWESDGILRVLEVEKYECDIEDVDKISFDLSAVDYVYRENNKIELYLPKNRNYYSVKLNDLSDNIEFPQVEPETPNFDLDSGEGVGEGIINLFDAFDDIMARTNPYNEIGKELEKIIKENLDNEIGVVVLVWTLRGILSVPIIPNDPTLTSKLQNAPFLSGYFECGDGGSSAAIIPMKVTGKEINELLNVCWAYDYDGDCEDFGIQIYTQDDYLSCKMDSEAYELQNYNEVKKVLNFSYDELLAGYNKAVERHEFYVATEDYIKDCDKVVITNKSVPVGNVKQNHGRNPLTADLTIYEYLDGSVKAFIYCYGLGIKNQVELEKTGNPNSWLNGYRIKETTPTPVSSEELENTDW